MDSGGGAFVFARHLRRFEILPPRAGHGLSKGLDVVVTLRATVTHGFWARQTARLADPQDLLIDRRPRDLPESLPYEPYRVRYGGFRYQNRRFGCGLQCGQALAGY
jgi:hypothetical protein